MISSEQIIEALKEKNLLLKKNKCIEPFNLSEIQTDSRKIKSGDVFICITGYVFDGNDYIEQAIKNGARLIISENHLNIDLPTIQVSSSRKTAALLAKLFYHDPTSKFILVGVTGTNGKTTIVQLLNKILISCGKKTGTIGTLGYTIGKINYEQERTTPDIVDLHKIFSQMIAAKIEIVIMEVSSHAISLDRIFGLKFDLAIFTNLSREHLDFHHSMTEYASAKFEFLLQTKLNNGKIILNFDDDMGIEFYRNLQSEIFRISFYNREVEFSVDLIKTGFSGSVFRLYHEHKITYYASSLIGKHNIFNLVAVLATLKTLNYDITSPSVLKSISQLNEVKGRMQRVKEIRNKNIFIDYAHSPDALRNVLTSLKELKPERLICLFGAGGERDSGKRPQMLSQVLTNADVAIITNDNPRNENPEKIIFDIVEEADQNSNFWIIRDRKKAIFSAIRICREQDILLIAGKGHEQYQIVENQKLVFDDYQEAIEAAKQTFDIKTSNGLAVPLDALMLQVTANYFLNKKSDDPVDDKYFYNLSTDSRQIKPNTLFFALKGENFDGHDFVEDVLAREGCAAVVRQDFPKCYNLIYTAPDPLLIYGAIAKRYCKLFGTYLIAITGSVGKSTTKEYIANILGLRFNVLKTWSNENNQIGLPRTLFRLKPEHDYAILELGSNHRGEIEYLAAICRPDAAIVTSIGASHLEFFNDMEGVYQEKSSLLRRELKLRIFPGDEPRFSEFTGIQCGKGSNNNYKLHSLNTKIQETEFSVNDENYFIPTSFSYFAENALFAIALSIELEINPNIIQKGLSLPLDINWRMEIINREKYTILADCYNANPDSMKAAIDFWRHFSVDKPHIAILGDMLELGNLTEKYHRQIYEMLKDGTYEKIISVGNAALHYGAEYHFNEVESLLDSDLLEDIPTGSVILLKASHGIRLEKILERI